MKLHPSNTGIWLEGSLGPHEELCRILTKKIQRKKWQSTSRSCRTKPKQIIINALQRAPGQAAIKFTNHRRDDSFCDIATMNHRYPSVHEKLDDNLRINISDSTIL